MKKMLMLATTAVVVLMLGVSAGYAQPMGPGYRYGMGPWMMRGYRMGPGMMGYCYGMRPWMMRGYRMGPGMMGYGYGMGPWMMRGYRMGPGPMSYGYGMGPWMMRGYGMMGPGYGYGYWPRYGYGPQYQGPQKPLEADQAKQEVENYLRSMRNPNLKVGNIEEKGNVYEVDIVTKDGSLVNKILVDKDTGRMRSAY